MNRGRQEESMSFKTCTKWRPLLALGVVVSSLAGAGSAAELFGVTARLQSGETGHVLRVEFTIQPSNHLYADRIRVIPPEGMELVPLQIPPAEEKTYASGDAPDRVYEHDVALTYEIRGDVSTGLTVKIKYQGCSENQCFLPATKTVTMGPVLANPVPPPPPAPAADVGAAAGWQDALPAFTVAGQAVGYMPASEFLRFLDEAESGRGTPKDRLQTLFDRKGIWIGLAIVLILLGGLALNLTPCVLPMIPINIAIIGAGAQAGSRLRGLALGAMYGAGIALSYGALGLFVVLTGAKFGALNSSPLFNAVVAILFVVLALGMFDVFTIDFSRFQGTAGTGVNRGRFLTVFFMGGVSALLAGACVAPVVVSVLLLSTNLYQRSQAVGLLLPFLLGIGMALPWPLAGAGLSFLPKPGRWMERVKRAFGILILLMAAWYGYESCRLAHCWSPGHRAETARAQQEATLSQGWMTSLDAALALAQQENRLLIVDFWASWCKNCLAMDETTFKNDKVNDRLGAYVRTKYQADDLSDPEIRAVLDRFGVAGLPTYVVLRPTRPSAAREEE